MLESESFPEENVNQHLENGIESVDVNYETLKGLCENNANYFINDKSDNGKLSHRSLLCIKEAVDAILPMVLQVRSTASKFDFNEDIQANGYRSFIILVDKAVLYSIRINKNICLCRDNVLFSKSSATRDLEACASLFRSLIVFGNCLKILFANSKDEELFAADVTMNEELLKECEDLDLHCFYGRNLGFQFCDSIRPILQFVNLSMAIFSEAYYSRGSFFSKAKDSVATTAKYLMNPEERGKRISNIARNANLDFCKSFWFLAESELMKQVPTVAGLTVAVSKIILIPPEPLSIEFNGKTIDVPIPTSYIGKKPIQVRLISYDAREGMVGEARAKNVLPPSRGLLFHCHGGGYVAQSSQSHECYLREWTKQLKVPILSLDYSLTPQAPYPRALEEALYAYCWALKNCHLLGSTGERVVMAGDSAGGNLLTGLIQKCIMLDIPLSQGLFLVYSPTWLTLNPSPSRLLCLLDPLLPMGFVSRLLKAYATPIKHKLNGAENGENTSDTESFEEITQSDLDELQAHKSPISETSESVTYGSLSSPTLDAKDTVRHLDISDLDFNASDGDQSTSQNVNVSDFLERYVLDSDTETDGTKVAVLTQECASPSKMHKHTMQNKVSSIVANLRSTIGNWVARKRSGAQVFLDHDRYSMLELTFRAPDDPIMSIFLTSDDILKKLPRIKALTTELDPFIDDNIVFCKRMKKLNKDITLDVVPGLPHGFLNFSLLCKEANEGSKLCIERIQELMDLDNLPPLQTTS